MSYQALARKWRPQNFRELVGQQHVVSALVNALDTQRLHHAYLFTGTRGVGKTTLARILAKSLNCETGITSVPCGICDACKSISTGSFVDLLEVDAATNTRVEEMRELLDNTQYMPTVGRFKVYIIDEVHMLSRSAFNSMLKTLEEPPEHVKFILATTDPQKVPVTILSRCLQFNLRQMPREAIAGHLVNVLTSENIPFEKNALNALAHAAQGSMRDSLSLLDQAIAYGGGEVKEQTVAEMLGAIDQSYLFNLLEYVATNDGQSLLKEAERMAERSISFDAALQELAALLHQIAIRQASLVQIDTSEPNEERFAKLANLFSAEDIQLFYQIAIVGRRDLSLAPDEFAGFSMTLLRMLAFTVDRQVNNSKMSNDKPVAQPPKIVSQNPSASEPAAAKPRAPQPELVKARPIGEQKKPVDSQKPVIEFDGNWLGLISKLKLAGMAGMLAQHSEIKSFKHDAIQLIVPASYKHLIEKNFIEKLRSALSNHFGTDIAIQVEIGESSGNTMVEVEAKHAQEKQAQAIVSIHQDSFVRTLVENMDARVIDSSIRPI